MNISLHLGWWLIPTIITLVSFLKAARYGANRESGGDYDSRIDIVIAWYAALIISLLSYVVYFGICLYVF